MTDWKELYEQYDYFLIDVWGVLMDGETAYPLANNLINDLNEAGKEIVLLSNTPDNAESLIGILKEMEIQIDCVKDIMTSGKATRTFLTDPTIDLGKTYYKIGNDRHNHLLDGLDYQKLDCNTEIDFLLVTSYEEHFMEQHNLEYCINKQVPLLCVNPDISIKTLEGKVNYCAGEVARRYEANGGQVIYVGKPYGLIFDIAMTSFSNRELRRTIMIGDNPKTDIIGADRFGIDSALVNNQVKSKLASYHYQNFTQIA